jgi:hypothetical protein
MSTRNARFFFLFFAIFSKILRLKGIYFNGKAKFNGRGAVLEAKAKGKTGRRGDS